MTATNASTPAGKPPSGILPNFTSPASLYPEMLASVVLSYALTTLFISIRLFTKWFASSWALEDSRPIHATLDRAIANDLIQLFCFLPG